MKKLMALIVLGLLVGAPVAAQSTTKICIPVPPVAGGVAGCQDVNAANGFPVKTVTLITLRALNVSTAPTAGVAVTAINAGGRTAGGWIKNPVGAKPLCINEAGIASGTKSVGSVTCIVGGEIYSLAPSSNAVSVVAQVTPITRLVALVGQTLPRITDSMNVLSSLFNVESSLLVTSSDYWGGAADNSHGDGDVPSDAAVGSR